MNSVEFTLRDFNSGDAESVVKSANNPEVSKYLRDRFPSPYTLKDAHEFIEIFLPATQGKVFAIDIGGKAVGAIGLNIQPDENRMNAELGYWLAEEFWNKGVMSEAVKRIVVFGFEKLNIIKIYAKVYEGNTASSVILEKNGFQLEARMKKNAIKNGLYVDELFYSKFKEEIQEVL